MREFISLDIETTGLNLRRSEILQIALVVDDGKTDVDKLQTRNVCIQYDSIPYCEPYAMAMNASLLKEISHKNTVAVQPIEAIYTLVYTMEELKEKTGKKVILAGKNVSSFDIPMLREWIERHQYPAKFDHLKNLLKRFDNAVHYKTLDVGSMYWDHFGDNVSLSEINKLTGRKEVSHDALDDALDVVYAVRHKMDKRGNK